MFKFLVIYMLRCFLGFLCLVFCSFSVVFADKSEETLDEFMSHVQEQEGFSDEDKQRIQTLVETLREDEAIRDTVITEALRRMHSEFHQAIRGLADIDTESAMRQLMELTQSEDPYLAADATFFLARGYIQQENYESALPLLRRVTGKMKSHTLRQAEALFFQASAEMQALDHGAALNSLGRFEAQRLSTNPRMRAEASAMRFQLEQNQEGSLPDVASHMGFSRRKLGLSDPGADTQDVQDKIVTMLDVLIAQAEEQEQQQSKSQGQGQGQAQGNQPGQKPGQGAMPIPDPKTNAFDRPDLNAKRSEWDNPRERERRAEALNALKDRFPARYQQLIEQYSLDLQQEEEDE